MQGSKLNSATLRRKKAMVGRAIRPSRACIASVGTANAGTSYSQRELIDLLNIKNERVRSLFLRGSIDRRYLTLPPIREDGSRLPESQAELLKKHRRCAVSMGLSAIHECLNGMGAQIRDVSYLCCVTSTGFMTPGISAYLAKELELTADCTRLDVVGMGCNAGLNGLNAAATWSVANPGKLGLLLCAEVCSAAYVFDDTMGSSVVNSLFGDGAAAAAIIAEPSGYGANQWPSIERFQSRLVSSAIEGMRFDWDETHGRFSFYLDPVVPYLVGANVSPLVADLLAAAGVRRSSIRHWLVHSGGKKVIDAVRINLGLSSNDLRHTSGVLREFGNLSSGSFLFSYKRLLQEQALRHGDYGVMITMGPGTTIESALLRW